MEALEQVRWLLSPAVAGVAVAVLAGVLSPVVVTKRMAFIGQGVSHAAFGAAGVAAVLGLALGAGAGASVLTSPAGYYVVVGGFCVGAALVIGASSGQGGRRGGVGGGAGGRGGGLDTGIGVVLVASMALGAILLRIAADAGGPRVPLETLLFGSLLGVTRGDAAAAWIVAGACVALAWVGRRPALAWAFDERGARSLGVRTGAVRAAVLVLLAVAIVLAMRLAGVLLATSLLVLPGATALRLSDRLGAVWAVSIGTGVAGVAGGLAASVATDWPPGPTIAAVQTAMWAAACVIGAASAGSWPSRGKS